MKHRIPAAARSDTDLLLTLDGRQGSGDASTAVTATLAAESMVSDHPEGMFQTSWNRKEAQQVKNE